MAPQHASGCAQRFVQRQPSLQEARYLTKNSQRPRRLFRRRLRLLLVDAVLIQERVGHGEPRVRIRDNVLLWRTTRWHVTSSCCLPSRLAACLFWSATRAAQDI